MDDVLFEKVKDYFGGALTPEERLRLESEAKTNGELAALFALYRSIEEGIPDAGEVSSAEEAVLRNTLKKAHEGFLAKEGLSGVQPPQKAGKEKPFSSVAGGEEFSAGKEEAVKKMNAWKRLAVAAIATGVILAIALWLVNREPGGPQMASGSDSVEPSAGGAPPDTLPAQVTPPAKDTAGQEAQKTVPQQPGTLKPERNGVPAKAAREALYAQHFRPDALPPDYSDLLQEALLHFQEQEYPEAVAAIDIAAIQASLEERRPRGPLNEQLEKEEKETLFYAHYYKALSYMAAGRGRKAIAEWQRALAKSPDRHWRGRAQWYLSLANLKEGDVREAKRWLLRVANTPEAGAYRQKAVTLIKALDAGAQGLPGK